MLTRKRGGKFQLFAYRWLLGTLEPHAKAAKDAKAKSIT
jgi:hypothetical protein